MANIDFAGFNLNPAALKKFGWGSSSPTVFTGGLNLPAPASAPSAAPQENPFSGTLRKYADAYERQRKDVMSKMGKDDLGIGAAIALSQMGPSPEQLEQQAELRYREAQLAQKMSQENLELLSKKSRENKARDFTYNQFNNLLNSIRLAASPIPYEKTQELAANIANITNARNLSPQPDIRDATLSMPGRQYFPA